MNIQNALDSLRRLGFELSGGTEDSPAYNFDYEGITLLLIPEGATSESIAMFVPAIAEVTAENRPLMLEAMARLTMEMKYIQPAIIGDRLWLQYTHFLGKNGQPDDELMEHMVRALNAGLDRFHSIMEEEEAGPLPEDDDDADQ